MSLFMLLYDDNSNSFLVVATLPKIRCSVKWQSMHKTVCVCVFKECPVELLANYRDQDVIVLIIYISNRKNKEILLCLFQAYILFLLITIL